MMLPFRAVAGDALKAIIVSPAMAIITIMIAIPISTWSVSAVAPPVTWQQDGEQYVSVVSGWGGAVPLWGGDVAKKVNYLEQGGMVWVFKLPSASASAKH